MISILTQNQINIIKKIGKNKFISDNFYLTGGTALAEFYLQHRYSEDLDFFSETEIDVLPLNVFMSGLKKELNISKIDYQQNFNRNLFFLHFKDEILKTEFTFFPFQRIESGPSHKGITIDSLFDIAVNKLFTIYQRTKARDYVDLYFICAEKGFTIVDLTKRARIKFDYHIDPLQLGTQFLKAQEAKDYPRMIKELDNQTWQSFFIEEAKKLSSEIIK
ncbi:MAG: nucleotidyl transferase AbiEii/AbiGii toxin family protein [bacterium]|nr:nucleotidyl transferase AbiEii/AbiGii toxin family protein [bacterium]